MPLKDRLKKIAPEKKVVAKKISKKSSYENIFDRLLENSENIIFCCPLDITPAMAIDFVGNKILPEERVVAIGEKLNLQRNELVKFEPDKKNIGKELIKTALQFNASKILIENFIGAEAIDILKLVNSNIKNIYTTVQANTPLNAMHQMELNLYLSGINIPEKLLRTILTKFVDKLVFLETYNSECAVSLIYEVNLDNNGEYVLEEWTSAKKNISGINGFDKNILNKKFSDVLEHVAEVNSKTEKEETPKKIKNILARKLKHNKLID